MKKLVFVEGGAVANESGAMETRDHLKNGASSKSQQSRRNILRKACLGLVAAGVVVSLGIGLSACSNAYAQGGKINAPVKWEYMQLCGSFDCDRNTKQNRDYDIVQDLNRLGNEGWELVSTSTCQYSGGTQLHGIVYTFKRQLP
jgi:hypothetical protein